MINHGDRHNFNPLVKISPTFSHSDHSGIGHKIWWKGLNFIAPLGGITFAHIPDERWNDCAQPPPKKSSTFAHNTYFKYLLRLRTDNMYNSIKCLLVLVKLEEIVEYHLCIYINK